jgi:esterase/lipase/1-acyl-sn-glycerol-3-phosphate acyltransferase
MDRQERLTTFTAYPDPPPLPAAGPGFGTDLHQTLGGVQPPTTRYSRMARKATGVSLRLIEALMRSTIRVEGMQNVTPGPVLFVANHFTRFETFVLPYIIDGHLGRRVHSLAFHKLFRGRFGDFLMSVGARPTGDPVVKHTMIEDLMTGRNDWLIYPEGSMVKNKKIWANGQYKLDAPDRVGMPHSGAAIMALKAMIYKQLYRQACTKGDEELVNRYQNRYHLKGPADIEVPDLQVIPVNISYYPIRPSHNIVARLARWMFRQMPSVLEEELLLEGSLLFSETDISIYFGKPLRMDHYLRLVMPTLQQELPFVDQLRRANTIMGALKNRLTRRMMHEVYTRLTINFDHLFCSGLRNLTTDTVPTEDFHQALYLATRQIQADGKRRSHPSLSREMVDLVCGLPYQPLTSVQGLAQMEKSLTITDGEYRIDRAALKHEHSFHDIRLKNTVSVIANELEPMRKAIRIIRNALALPRTVRRRQIAALLQQEERDEFINERRAVAASPHIKDESIGAPFVLHRADDRIGIVLCHGYLAAPIEVRSLAEHLHRLGHTVYVPRLTGHGTAPEQLMNATADDWLRCYLRAVTVLKATCQRVILGGFSAGGLLALEAAAMHQDALGCFVINPCMQIADPKASLVPLVMGWNQVMDGLHLGAAKYERMTNRPENIDSNYPVNYLSGVYQLERMIHRCRGSLDKVTAPTLIVQGDHDPVVKPASGQDALDCIRSEEKELAMMAFNRHVILRGEGSEAVLERVGEFVQKLAQRSRPLASRR